MKTSKETMMTWQNEGEDGEENEDDDGADNGKLRSRY